MEFGSSLPFSTRFARRLTLLGVSHRSAERRDCLLNLGYRSIKVDIAAFILEKHDVDSKITMAEFDGDRGLLVVGVEEIGS